MAARGAQYAERVWPFESPTWSGKETRRYLAWAFKAGMRAQKRALQGEAGHAK